MNPNPGGLTPEQSNLFIAELLSKARTSVSEGKAGEALTAVLAAVRHQRGEAGNKQ
jgi:hypothetical protein